ncbi:DNA-binding protein [Clostridia bacterium]|nr:DNA-binding protein [Clostridia bacterium]GHV35980.1 DNA-binding protein [Clostridia bacterium]
MKILIDTNVIIDVFTKREPHYAASAEVLKLSEKRDITLYVTVSQATDIFYILNRHLKDMAQTLAIVKTIGDNMTVADVTAADFQNAINSGFDDFEDAMLAASAKRIKANCIVTRNVRDFAKSAVAAISPDEFLAKYFPEDLGD